MLLIIFGAGASYDHHPNQSSDSVMPMANGLIYDNLHNAGDAKNTWQGAVPIINILQEIENQNKQGFNIEEALFAILEENDENINAQLLSFLFYVHRVISSVESNIRRYENANTNYTRLLTKLQKTKVDRDMGIRIVSFNYDTLIEAACGQVYPTWVFNTYEDYLLGPGVRLYKPHGSLNWQKLTNGIDHQTREESVIKLLAGRYSNNPTTERIVRYSDMYQSHTLGKTHLMQPVLALPFKEKTNFVFPDNHKSSLVNDMNKITHILTVGWRGSESHFHQQILDKLPSKAKIKIMNVNRGSEEIETNLKETLKDRIITLDTFNEGFSKFLEDDDILKKFLS